MSTGTVPHRRAAGSRTDRNHDNTMRALTHVIAVADEFGQPELGDGLFHLKDGVVRHYREHGDDPGADGHR